ncbi:MAG: folate family ECF transporter S component [Erysipelotrichaceae bacterium]|nr:folate family ECF transporter S component [Erysipelotrichaceae bacterium]
MKKVDTKMLVSIALLIALNVVFSRIISISTLSFKISFTFVTVFLAAYLYGPFVSVLVASAGDFIGALLFPVGAYNPLFTITAALSGLVYGIFLYKNNNLIKQLITVFLNRIVVSLFINTYFISIVIDKPLSLLIPTRIMQNVVMLVIEFITIRMLAKYIPKLKELADGK